MRPCDSRNLKLAIRVDASREIGTGHFMRCLTLADALRPHCAEIRFISRHADTFLEELVGAKGHTFSRLRARPVARDDTGLAHGSWLGVPQDDDADDTLDILDGAAWDWLVVDHYGLDTRWEQRMRSKVRRIFVIDDLADRVHDCDLLLDQNLNDEMEGRYAGLVPEECETLVGPKYALLRPEFGEARNSLRARNGKVRRIFVFFGGADSSNETGKAIEAVRLLGRDDIAVDIVIGASNPHRGALEASCREMPLVNLHCQVGHIASLMAQADLALGAGGGAMWERFCVGLPSVVLAVAENQRSGSETAARDGLVIYLGDAMGADASLLRSVLQAACATPHLLNRMSERGLDLVDGRGAARLAEKMLAAPLALRRAALADCRSVYEWRNAEEVRRYSGDSKEIAHEDHVRWYEKMLANPDRVTLIAESGGEPVGVLRYDREGERATVSVYLVPGRLGRGIGTRLLKEGSRWIEREWPAVRVIDASIRPENKASVAAFKSAGYVPDFHVYTKQIRG